MPTTQPVRTLLCTSGGLFGALVLRRLLRCRELSVVGVVYSTRILKPNYGFLRGAWEQQRRSGLAYTLYLGCATALAEWLSDLRSGGSVPRIAAVRGIPLLQTRDVNAAAGMEFVAAAAPDLLISSFFNQLLAPALLAIPRAAAINIHPSLLPDGAGVDPVFHAMLRRQPTLGVTIHHLSAQFDRGNVLLQAAQPHRPGTSVFRATAQLYARGAELLADGLAAIVAGDPGTPQPAGGTYDSWPTRGQVRRLRTGGACLISLWDLAWIETIAAQPP